MGTRVMLLGSDSEAADNLLTVSSLTATLPAAAAAAAVTSVNKQQQKHTVQFVQ